MKIKVVYSYVRCPVCKRYVHYNRLESIYVPNTGIFIRIQYTLLQHPLQKDKVRTVRAEGI
jgi:hypothetical protein